MSFETDWRCGADYLQGTLDVLREEQQSVVARILTEIGQLEKETVLPLDDDFRNELLTSRTCAALVGELIAVTAEIVTVRKLLREAEKKEVL